MGRFSSSLALGLATLLITAGAAWGQGSTTRVVDDDGAGNATACDAPEGTFSTIGAAIGASMSGDTVVVCPGTYVENINFGGRNITLRSAAGPDVTRIDGNAADSVVTFAASEGPTAVLDGFTIQNGRSGFDTPGFGDGGGIRILATSPTIRNNIVINNRACSGIGVSIRAGSPLVEGNVISDNIQHGCSGGIGGGGIAILGTSTAIIRSNTISHNLLTSADGGGISLFAAGWPTIDRNVISDNSATGVSPCTRGGGISLVNHSDATITGNVIVRNSAGCGGGIAWLVPIGSIGPRVVNNTIAANNGAQGSGILADGFDVQAQLVNNLIVALPGQTAVFCGNFNDVNPPSFNSNNVVAPSGVVYGGICGEQTGFNGNISAAPLFANAAAGDFHLMPGSPGIDAGSNAAPSLPAFDADGHPRVVDGDAVPGAIVDIGADEIGPLPTLMLKVNGRRPSPAVVFTAGAVHLTLNSTPTTYAKTLDWYWAVVAKGQLVWVTSTGLSPTAAPLVNSPAIAFNDVTLLNAVFEPGTTLTNAFFLVSGSTVISMDVMTAVVVR